MHQVTQVKKASLPCTGSCLCSMWLPLVTAPSSCLPTGNKSSNLGKISLLFSVVLPFCYNPQQYSLLQADFEISINEIMLQRRLLNPASLAQRMFWSFIPVVNAATMCPCLLLYSIPLGGYITIYVPILLSLIFGAHRERCLQHSYKCQEVKCEYISLGEGCWVNNDRQTILQSSFPSL